MNATEHLLARLAEEGSEVTKDCLKALAFGLDDRNVLNPEGPTNRERIVEELNDLMGVVRMLCDRGHIPYDWQDGEKQDAKVARVSKFMAYAREVGALQ